ncbi:hypothetical protein HZA96_06960 [Candidatus Woesearchaeota archaeon]|nr:hypothetical protein [Candidatus Woesearchaeota archaeon]
MKAQIQRRDNPFKSKYSSEDYDTARTFATKIYKEFGAFIKAIMIFGGESAKTSEIAPQLNEVSDPEEKHKSFLKEIKETLTSQQSAANQFLQNSLQNPAEQNKIMHDKHGHLIPQPYSSPHQTFNQDKANQASNNPYVKGDIDILIIVDNVSFYLTPEIIEVYRVVTERIAVETSKRLHITTLRITSFWEYMRVGDPIGINILRSGIALIDTGFIYPMQLLLFEGRIRPTPESVSSYFNRSSSSMLTSKGHIIQATLDLYWAAIDASHAAVMHLGEIPASPREISSILYERFVKTGKINKKYPATMEKMYQLSREILHRERKSIDGKEYQQLAEEAQEFVDVMRKLSGRK